MAAAEWLRYRCRGWQGQPLGLLPPSVALLAGVCQFCPQQFGDGTQGGYLRFQYRCVVLRHQRHRFTRAGLGRLENPLQFGGVNHQATGFTQRQSGHGSPPRYRGGRSAPAARSQATVNEWLPKSVDFEAFKKPASVSSLNRLHHPGLLRAADLIGQLADINYLRKTPALFAEFQETGAIEKLGYQTSDDLRAAYPAFFWQAVRPYIGDALRYLRVTQEGKQWVSNLYAHVFSEEHRGEFATP